MNFYNKEETQFHLKVCIELKNHIQRKYKFWVHREWYLILDDEDIIRGVPQEHITEDQKLRREKYRNPDLLWWNNGLWILEVDGYVHHKKSANTEKRDNVYQKNNCKYLVVKTYEMGKTKVINRSIQSIIDEVDLKLEELS